MKLTALLMSACAASVLMAGLASAQSDSETSDPVYLEADTLIEDREGGTYIARGSVRLASGTRIILADELIYDPEGGRITARGNVEVFEGNAAPQTADELILDSELEEGVAYGFATLLENNGKAAAAAALRRPGGRVELRDAYYTSCDLCEEEGHEPTWRLRAREVVRDTENDMIRYRDMRLEVEGVPVLYAPYFAHADPAAERQSGFLLPSVDISNRLGLTYQQPYFWALSDYQDLVIAPQLMTSANPLLEVEYRHRFYSGVLNVETSLTYEQEYRDPDPTDNIERGDWTGENEFRGHIFADGRFQLNPNFSAGFGVQAVYDPLYLRRYSYEEAPEETSALFEFSQRTLINQAYVTGRGERYYTDISTVAFKRLDEDFDNDTFPVVAPLVRFEGELPIPDALGDVDVRFNTVNLTRELGDDYTRASLGFDWTRPAILPGGLRAEAFATARVDAFHFTETDRDGAELDESTFTRALGAGGAEVSWPFLRPGRLLDVIVAPRVFAVAASGLDASQTVPLTDSGVFDLDRSNLFRANRTGGFDVWEDGARTDVGLSTVFESHTLLEPRLEVFAGRSYRLDGDPRLTESSGVFEDESDWVAEIQADTLVANFAARTRIDTETGDLNRLDINAGLDIWRVAFDATYTDIADAAAPSGFEELQAAVAFDVTDNWSLIYEVQRDIELQETRRTQAGIRYQDECTDLRIYWERENLKIADLGPSEAIKFEVVLFTLGGVGED